MVILTTYAAVSAALLLTGVYGQNARPRPASLVDPRTAFARNFTLPDPSFPGLQTDIEPVPDCGEESYVGNGRLRGRRALITGGDSGFGRMAAIAWAREGADIAINYLGVEQSDAESLRDVIESTTNSTVYLIPGNIRNETFCNQLVETAAERLGGLDILFNNAGYSQAYYNFTDIRTATFVQTAETNIYAPFWLTRAAVPLMPPGSSIIFTSSAQISSPNYFLSDYGASKAWLAAFTRALSAGLTRNYGIKVNAVTPPLTLTPFVPAQGLNTTQALQAAGTTPMGRIMQPVEMAPLLVAMVEGGSSYTTGAVLGWD
jgi:NAD(P)-dependent dehydrogenase (short-subunit alcohol dehydrogenase family)